MDKRNIRKETLFSEEEFSLIQQKSYRAGIQPAVFIREAALSKDINAALSQQEIDMIRRSQKVSVALQTNLNQIAKLCHNHDFLPLYDYIIQLIRNIDRYFQTGDWTNVNIPENIKQLEDILKEADAKYQDLRNKALSLYYFTHEGENFFKERYKCSIFSNKQNTKYYFRVQGSNQLAMEIPEQLFNDYRNRKVSIKNIYDYWNTKQ